MPKIKVDKKTVSERHSQSSAEGVFSDADALFKLEEVLLNGIKSFSFPYHRYLEENGMKLDEMSESLALAKRAKKSSTIMQLDSVAPALEQLSKSHLKRGELLPKMESQGADQAEEGEENLESDDGLETSLIQELPLKGAERTGDEDPKFNMSFSSNLK